MTRFVQKKFFGLSQVTCLCANYTWRLGDLFDGQARTRIGSIDSHGETTGLSPLAGQSLVLWSQIHKSKPQSIVLLKFLSLYYVYNSSTGRAGHITRSGLWKRNRFHLRMQRAVAARGSGKYWVVVFTYICLFLFRFFKFSSFKICQAVTHLSWECKFTQQPF